MASLIEVRDMLASGRMRGDHSSASPACSAAAGRCHAESSWKPWESVRITEDANGCFVRQPQKLPLREKPALWWWALR